MMGASWDRSLQVAAAKAQSLRRPEVDRPREQDQADYLETSPLKQLGHEQRPHRLRERPSRAAKAERPRHALGRERTPILLYSGYLRNQPASGEGAVEHGVRRQVDLLRTHVAVEPLHLPVALLLHPGARGRWCCPFRQARTGPGVGCVAGSRAALPASPSGPRRAPVPSRCCCPTSPPPAAPASSKTWVFSFERDPRRSARQSLCPPCLRLRHRWRPCKASRPTRNTWACVRREDPR